MKQSTIDLAQKLLRTKQDFSKAVVTGCSHLAGDASLRTYSRINLENAPVDSAILMTLKKNLGPVGGGPEGLTQDDTFVELAGFLREQGIEVPLIYVDARDEEVLILEDVGSVCLAEASKVQAKDLYKGAIDLIIRLQSIRRADSCVAFRRSPTLDQLREQASEFVEHYALPRGLAVTDRETLSSLISEICNAVHAHPRVLTHYDFTAYNLFVSPSGSIRPLDFQDACLDSPARDLVALIDDRDSDAALGPDLHAELLDYFCSFFPEREKALQWYHQYKIHWHLRVTGRFALLSEKRGMPRYAAWIPGSVRRLLAALKEVQGSVPGAGEVIPIVEGLRASPLSS